MRRLLLAPLVTLAAFVSLLRPGPAADPGGGTGAGRACTPAEAASTINAHGLAFLGPPWLGEYLLVSQRPDSVLEISRPVRIGLRRSLADRLYPQVMRRPDATFGTAYHADAEALLRLHAAVVLQEAFAPRLTALGLCAVGITRHYATPSAIIEHTGLYAAISDEPNRAAPLVARFDADMATLAHDVSALPAAARPRVLNLDISRSGAIFAEAGGHPASQFIARAGGRNALSDTPGLGARLDAERLFRLDPDDMFLLQALAGKTPTPAALRRSRLAGLRAIRTGHVFDMPPEWTVMDSVVATPAYERFMAERLHPALAGSARDALRTAFAAAMGVVPPEQWLDAALPGSRP